MLMQFTPSPSDKLAVYEVPLKDVHVENVQVK
jgi:hypothetical protein